MGENAHPSGLGWALGSPISKAKWRDEPCQPLLLCLQGSSS